MKSFQFKKMNAVRFKWMAAGTARDRVSMHGSQRGSFVVEFALVLVVFSSLFAMVVNYSVAINTKGQLDRVAYSLATIVAERRQLFNSSLDVCEPENSGDCSQRGNDLYSLVSASMASMMPNFDQTKFGLRVEQVSLDREVVSSGGAEFDKRYERVDKGAISQCDITTEAQKMNEEDAKRLLPLTTRGRRLPLYQVSVCYAVPFNLLGITSGEVNYVVSTSYAFARV